MSDEHWDRRSLLNRAIVQLNILDEAGRELGSGTGLLTRSVDEVALYTAWHLFSGLDFINKKLPSSYGFSRRKVRITYPSIEVVMREGEPAGYLTKAEPAEITLELYDSKDGRLVPRWEQDSTAAYRIASDHDAFFPQHHDVCRIRVDAAIDTMNLVSVPTSWFANLLPWEGSATFIGGYPHGLHAGDGGSRSPIWLTRHSASVHDAKGFIWTHLIEPGCLPGMSGAPVIIDDGGNLHVIGVYTGLLFIDTTESAKNPLATLGIYTGWQIINTQIAKIPNNMPLLL